MPGEKPPVAAAGPRLRLTEIFCSIQGESSRVGLPTVFVRLTGCPLRCRWCDTEYAFNGGKHWNIDEVLAEVARHAVPTVCVTGGEPLAQKACLPLLARLCDAGYSVSLETSGAIDIGSVDPRVSRIMDLKAPGSAEASKNRWENIPLLNAGDEIKIVLSNRKDYDWAVEQLDAYRLTERCPVLLSPVQGELAPADLAEWITADRLPVRMQIQLHKVIWGNQPGR